MLIDKDGKLIAVSNDDREFVKELDVFVEANLQRFCQELDTLTNTAELPQNGIIRSTLDGMKLTVGWGDLMFLQGVIRYHAVKRCAEEVQLFAGP